MFFIFDAERRGRHSQPEVGNDKIIGTGVYIDDVDRAIAREKELLQEQVRRLIFNILKASIVFILFFTILHFIETRYFQPKPAPTVSECKDTPPNIPKTGSQEQGTISVNDSLKLAQEISKVILAEQTKLLAFAISLQASQNDKEKSDLANDVKELADQVSRTVADIDKK